MAGNSESSEAETQEKGAAPREGNRRQSLVSHAPSGMAAEEVGKDDDDDDEGKGEDDRSDEVVKAFGAIRQKDSGTSWKDGNSSMMSGR